MSTFRIEALPNLFESDWHCNSLTSTFFIEYWQHIMLDESCYLLMMNAIFFINKTRQLSS